MMRFGWATNALLPGGNIPVLIFSTENRKILLRTQVGLQDELRILTKYNHIVFNDRQTILIEPSVYKKYELNVNLEGIPLPTC